MNLVFFDFDDTVTALDTTLPFGAHFAGRRHARLRIAFLVLALGLAKFRLLSNTGLKGIFARLFLRGRTLAGVRRLALEFQQARLGDLVDDEILGRLRMHVDRGDRVYLVSANFDCLLEPLVAHWSLAGIVATEAALAAEIYSGRLAGPACHGGEKLRRVVARFGPAEVRSATAYGNRDDAPLLDAVQTAFLVRRARASGLGERLRRARRVLSGQLTRADLPGAHRVEPYAVPGPTSAETTKT